MRNPQIGVIGSMADLQYSKALEAMAERIGELIAEHHGTLLFGAEKDSDSLSTAACRGAKRKGGLTIAIGYGIDKKIMHNHADVVIPTGLERGGGREFTLMLGCDAVIALSGGSGTLNEIAIAYMAGIPTIALTGLGGWADKLAGQFIDDRKRQQVLPATSPEEAVELAFREALHRIKQ